MRWSEREIRNLERQDPFRCQWPNVPRSLVVPEDTREAPEFDARDPRDIAAEEAVAEARSEEARGR